MNETAIKVVMALICVLIFFPEEAIGQEEASQSNNGTTVIVDSSAESGIDLDVEFGGYLYFIDRGHIDWVFDGDVGAGLAAAAQLTIHGLFTEAEPFLRASAGLGPIENYVELGLGLNVTSWFYVFIAAGAYDEWDNDEGHNRTYYERQYTFILGNGIRYRGFFLELNYFDWSDQQVSGVSTSRSPGNWSYTLFGQDGFGIKLGMFL
jgi:hypothetical protein